MRPSLPIVAFLGLILMGFEPSLGEERTSPTEEARFFDSQILPILKTHCINCHGGEKVRSDLNLTSREALLKGGSRGPAVSLTKPDESLLLKAVDHADLRMPPRGKLTQGQIDLLARWLKMGAPWGGGTVVKRPGPPPVDDQARNFWSFRPVTRPRLPVVEDAGWVRSPIDAFVLARLEAAGI